MLFYDQLGAGDSDEPRDTSLYSTAKSAQDLHTLLHHVFGTDSVENMSRYHLYGQSYGGLLLVVGSYQYSPIQSRL